MHERFEPRRSTGQGEIVVVHRSNAYLHTQLIGQFDMRFADELIATLEGWMGTRSDFVVFHDCSQIVDYDVEARERISNWSRACVARFDTVHLLVQGRIIAWGLRVISAVVGGKLVTYHERQDFERALAGKRAQAGIR